MKREQQRKRKMEGGGGEDAISGVEQRWRSCINTKSHAQEAQRAFQAADVKRAGISATD